MRIDQLSSLGIDQFCDSPSEQSLAIGYVFTFRATGQILSMNRHKGRKPQRTNAKPGRGLCQLDKICGRQFSSSNLVFQERCRGVARDYGPVKIEQCTGLGTRLRIGDFLQ